jgi:hypothetical protein
VEYFKGYMLNPIVGPSKEAVKLNALPVQFVDFFVTVSGISRFIGTIV